jgi:hypothetical protein
MRCWACPRAIRLGDLVNELPIVGALVHRACYERHTGTPAGRSISLGQWLSPFRRGDERTRAA